jgi:hypothetical protein
MWASKPLRVIVSAAAFVAAAVGFVLLIAWEGAGPKHIDPDELPLVEDAEVIASAEDPGVDYTTMQKPERYLLVAGPRGWSDARLKAAEVREVTDDGWRLEPAPTRRQVRARQEGGDVTAFFATPREVRIDDSRRRWRFGLPEELEPAFRRAERGPRAVVVVRLARKPAP